MLKEQESVLTVLQQKLGLNSETAKVLVVGLGSTGLSVARFLKNIGLQFAIVDSRNKPPEIDRMVEEMPDVAVFTGGFDQAAFEVATHLLVSPGVSLDELSIQKSMQAGCQVVSDIDLFACATDKPIVAITGSNGKSTVTTLLGEMAKHAGIDAAIGGNLGVPALDLLQQSASITVLELSSFQLERTSVLEPVAATVLNVSDDHLDRHQSLERYAAEKQRIFNGQGVMVLNRDDPRVMVMREAGRTVRTFSVQQQADYYWDQQQNMLMAGDEAVMPATELALQGLHNIANALAAIALADAAGFKREPMRQALRRFQGLPHRMQTVAEVNGVQWINDSKATNVGACVAALNGFDRNVVLIAGGDAKGADLSALTPAVAEHCKAVIVMGKDGALIADSVTDDMPRYTAEHMNEAVEMAHKVAKKGDVVLLSPACASLDQYKNYRQRGDKFTRAVKQQVQSI